MITCSITEARDQFASLIRRVELDKIAVQVTRRGDPVVNILSMSEYQRLVAHQPQQGFWQAHQTWHNQWQVDEGEDESDPFADIRGKQPGRDIELWY
jgi:prevent-host-death family protein